MMEKIEILAIGCHTEIMATIIRLINNKPGWNGTTALSAAEAIEKAKGTAYHVVLLGAGLSNADEQLLQAHFSVPVVPHYGGGSGLLYAEIYGALNSQ